LTSRDLAQDSEVAGWIKQANMTTDVEARRELLHMALRKVAAEAYALPLFSDNMNYAASGDLEFVTDAGGNPHFYLAHWK
jgi:peptide/nickel transport system substrate-binding protein